MSDAPTGATPYELLGGDAAVRRVVERFYHHMDTRPQSAAIRALHPPDLGESTEKLYEFLSGWLGGPALYMQRRGHPRLRARHMPFPVDTSARDEWLVCMDLALKDEGIPAQLRFDLMVALAKVADFMRNVEG